MKCHRCQHLDEAPDGTDVLFLSGEYVNHLKKEKENQIWFPKNLNLRYQSGHIPGRSKRSYDPFGGVSLSCSVFLLHVYGLQRLKSQSLKSQQSQPANQSEQTWLWFQTEGEKRCMRQIKSFLNMKSCKHVTVETRHTNMNLKMSIKCPLKELCTRVRVRIRVLRDHALTQALICGGVPAGQGPELRIVGRRCRSAPASRSDEPPSAQNHVGEFGPTYRRPHTLPAEGESCESCINHTCSDSHKTSHTYIFTQAVQKLLPLLPLSHRATCWGWFGSMWTLAAEQQLPKNNIW